MPGQAALKMMTLTSLQRLIALCNMASLSVQERAALKMMKIASLQTFIALRYTQLQIVDEQATSKQASLF